MSMINYASREINCKIVYYGSGLGGKTTNLEHIYQKVAPNTRGKMISLATETERTLFFDFLPVDLGTIRGFKTRFHLYTVPGQVYYKPHPTINDLQASLNPGWPIEDPAQQKVIPDPAHPGENLVERIGGDWIGHATHLEAVAVRGDGVFDTLKAVSKSVLKTLS